MINVFEIVAGMFIFSLLVAPIVLMTILVVRSFRKKPESKDNVSIEHIAALEQNDNLIVEDINTILSEIVSRLESIEDRLDREESTVKGFAKKSKQQLND